MDILEKETQMLEQISREIIELESDISWYRFYQEQQLPRLKNDLQTVLRLVEKNSKVLEIGSNPPFLLSAMTKLGIDAVGVDVNPELFSNTIKRYDLNVVQSNIELENLPFPSESFNFIVFCEVFEHLRINPVFTVSELYRLLKSGGILMLETPNLYSLKGIYNFLVKGKAYSCCTNSIYDEFKSIDDTGFFGHIREYSFQEVNLFLKQIGFKKIEIVYTGGGKRIWTKPIFKLAPFLRPSMMFLAVK